MKQLVFIDDSGDPGFRRNVSSPILVLAAIVFNDSAQAALVNEEITKLRQILGWKDGHEFKFRNTSKGIKMTFLQNVSRYDFNIYAVFFRKADYPNVFKFSNEEKLYNWTVKELLLTIPLKDAFIKIDGKYDKSYKLRVRSYFRKELNKNKTKRAIDFEVEDSKKDNLIQLADMVVGSINRALIADKTDSMAYLNIIKKKIIEIKQLNLAR